MPILERLQRRLAEVERPVLVVLMLLALSLAIRLLLVYIGNYQVDVPWGFQTDDASFRAWFDVASGQGISGFYDAVWSDYPPLNIYFFWAFGKLSEAVGPESLPFFIKLPQNLIDVATAFLIFSFLRRGFSPRIAIGGAALYAFNPAVIFDLAVWGQMDSIYTFFMVGSLYAAVRSKYEVSSGLLALAILTKPQGVILLPVVAYVIFVRGDWRRALSSVAVFGAAVFLVILPFNWDNPIVFLIDRYSGYGLYPYTSVNAYNIWSLTGFWNSDAGSYLGLTYQQWGIAAFVVLAGFIMWQLRRRCDARAVAFAAFLLMFAFFMVMTRMHERYLFPAFALLALAWCARGAIWIYLGITITFLIQLVYVLSVLRAETFISDGHWTIYVLAPANIFLLGFSLWTFYKMQRAGPPGAGVDLPQESPPLELPPPSVPLSPDVFLPLDAEPSGEEEERAPSSRSGIRLWSAQGGVAALTILFFALSIWNLGDLRSPSTDWDLYVTPIEVVVDLGEQVRVDKVFVFRRDTEKIEVELYKGVPGNWESVGVQEIPGDFRKWHSLTLGKETSHVRLRFLSGSGRIGEVALFSGEELLEISGIEVGGATGARVLVDEQHLVDDPRSHMANTYFDEVWYVPTAEQHLKLEEPSQWDHPPVSKLIMAASMAVFGHNPFGWRIAGVIFATMMIPLIYVLARRLFDSPRAGLIAAFLLTFDFMHFAQGRIATPETFILFFVMGMFYFFYRYAQDPQHGGRYLFLSLLFFGLGFSTKWVTAWGFIGLLLLLLLLKWRTPTRKWGRILVGLASVTFAFAPLALIPVLPESGRWLVVISVVFGLIPPLALVLFPKWRQSVHSSEVYWFAGGAVAAVSVYLLSYVPYFLAGHGLVDFWDMQLRIFGFHSGTTQPHSASSPWYTWPLMLKPVWFDVAYYDETRGYIASLGNPALWWGGMAAMAVTLWLAVRHRVMAAALIVIPFLAQWLMFAAVTRITFIYHFYPSVLFLILGLTLCAHMMWNRFGWGKWAVGGYLALNLACFVFFFPLISGLTMSGGYWDTLGWMVDWVVN